MDEQEKREVEKVIEEKKKEAPWWQKLNPVVLGVGLLVMYLIYRSGSDNPELRNKYFGWGAVILLILYVLSKSRRSEEKHIITSREAKILVAKECEFNRRCGEYPFTSMCEFQVGPVNPRRQTDATGTYNDIAVRVKPVRTDRLWKHYTARVICRGEQMGDVSFSEALGATHGREDVDKETIVPKWLKASQKYSTLEKMMTRREP